MTFEMKLTRADLDTLTTEELEAAYDEARSQLAVATGSLYSDLEAYVDMLGEALYERPCPFDDEEDEEAHRAS